MLSTQLITLIKITLLYYPTDTPPVSLETYPCYAPASGLPTTNKQLIGILKLIK